MRITKRQLRRIIMESLEDDFELSPSLPDRGYRDISDVYYWSEPIPFYWICSAKKLGWTYYAVIVENWTGDFFWSVHEKRGSLPARMSEKTIQKLKKGQDVGSDPISGPSKGKAGSLEEAKSRAEKTLDSILLRFDDFKKKYNIPV